MALTPNDMQGMRDTLDYMVGELDRMARYLDENYHEQKWVHRDIRAARGGIDRIAGHFRGELAEIAEAERAASLPKPDLPPWAAG